MARRVHRLYAIASLTGYGWGLAMEDFKEIREKNPGMTLPDAFDALEKKLWDVWPGRN